MDDQKLTPLDLKPAEPLPEAAPAPEVKITTGLGPQPEFFSPETLGPTPVPEGVAGKKNTLKTILIALGVLVFVGGVGALSYFVIFPFFFPPRAPVPAAQKPPVITAQLATHKSFLISPPAAEASITLKDYNYVTIAGALQDEALNQLADKQIKEVNISDSQGQSPFSKYLSAVAPTTSTINPKSLFEDDFTALIYYDGAGAWPIYVAKIKSGVSADAVKLGLKQIERSLDLSSFYVAPPGTFKVFKDGKVGKYATRYAVGTQTGAAFNYWVFGNYLIISTNYNGLKAALPLLGL